VKIIHISKIVQRNSFEIRFIYH